MEDAGWALFVCMSLLAACALRGWAAASRGWAAASRGWRETLDILGCPLTKEDVEEAASSLFISPGGGEGRVLAVVDIAGDTIDHKSITDVTALLCHHLGVKE